MIFKLNIWRQSGPDKKGDFKVYEIEASEDSSFLEMMDALNDKLTLQGEDPVAFDFDCREGICGSCNLVINGTPHGKQQATTT